MPSLFPKLEFWVYKTPEYFANIIHSFCEELRKKFKNFEETEQFYKPKIKTIMSLETFFNGKTVLVTSAGKGIGRALAVRLHNYGANVIAIAHTEDSLASLRKECPNVNTMCVELSDWDAARQALSELDPCDVVINNSTMNKLINIGGVGTFQSALDISCEKFDEASNVCLKSVLNVSQMTAQKMIEAKKEGSIVNVSTVAKRTAIPNAATYRATKASLDELSRSFAFELGKHNIRVNTVSLGCVWTPAFQRIMEISTGNSNPGFVSEAIKASSTVGGDPLVPMDDVVNTVLFVASGLPSKMSGGNVILDAGLSAA